METGKPGLVSAPVHINSVAAQTEKRMDIQAPLMAVYIPTVPALPAQPPAAAQEPATLHMTVPPLYSKDTLPFLTLHIAGGLQSQQGLSLTAASPAARPKSMGKHVCPHCGRDCMKPSVLEKHLRCHTGERPYPCATCGISFKTQSNLYKHKRTQAHARLSSESDQSCQGSLESMSSSRETSSMSLDEHSEESGSLERDATLPAAAITCPDNTAKVSAVKKHGSVNEQNELTLADHKTKEQNERAKVTKDGEKPPAAASRHLPLQRQEATLFSKQWESSVSRGKSQSHESTDSGFSESSDHYPSPGSALPDHSMDSLTESTKQRLEETINTQTPPEAGQGGQEPRGTAREHEHKTLEERISKLISENTAVVEDKQLENVRPRKTVLSKQGSIDLPMPYTYKDSFHFDMRISKTPSVGIQRHRNPGLYSSVPTQQSITMEHAPLARSNSLPFSVTLLQPERSSPTSLSQSDYVTLIRRESSGQINPTGFATKPVNQQSSTHRPLVRQTAVDCNHATDGLYMNSSVEEANTCSLSCDGDSTDICGEPSNRKFRRKKAQKFAYNKWYMYGGGTFKKLYNAEKGADDKGRKSSTNPEHEVVQGLQKRLSEVHKETVATTASTVNFTSGSAIVCHPDCSPAKLSFVSALDFNLKTTQLHPSCSSLKSPLRRNLSLSILPVPLIGTLVSHKTESRVDNRRLINEQKHIDSSSQLCGSQIPSDRKKQKTDDQMICTLETETDPTRLTHPSISVTSSTPQQATNIGYINPPKNLKHTQLKGALFAPCIINAKPPTVSTSPATSTPLAAKTSFLPKYQLKLPNAAEPDSNPSLHAVDKPTVTDGHDFSSALSSSYTEQTQISTLTSCDIKKTNALSCTQSQPLFTCTATTLCQAETSSVNKSATSSLDVVHRKFAAATITTTCRQDYQAGLCSTSVQPAGCTAPMHVPGTTAAMVNFPATSTITTANNQTANQTAFSQPNPNPLPHTQISSTSDQLSPVNRAYACSNTPVLPCQVVPFDQMQTNAQNVFHVHTGDLQICLQIISDEQLALIEPQIERQAGSTVPQRPDMEVVAPELMQRKAQSSDTMKSSNEGRDHQQPVHQKELDKSESLPTLNVERIKPSLSVQVGKVEPNPSLTEPSNSKQATVSAESKTPEALGLSRLPHKYGHVNMDSEAHVMSTAASLEGVKSGKSQTSEEERVLSLKRCAEEQLLPDGSVSQGGIGSTVFSQNNLSVTSLSSGTVNQNSTRRDTLGNESQHKLKNQGAPRNVGTTTAKGEAFACRSSKLDGGETNPPLQIEFGPAFAAACAEDLYDTVPSYFINKYNVPRQLEPQASIYCSNPLESALAVALNSSGHAKMKCDMVSPMDNSVLTQEITLGESQDVSAHSEKQMDQLTSECPHIQVGRRKDIPAVPASIHSPTAGLMDLSGCAAQKEPQTQEHGTPGQPDSTDRGPEQSQEPNCQCTEGQGSGGAAGEGTHRGIKADEQPGQWENEAESNFRYTCLQNTTKPEGEDREAKTDSINNSQLSEQHLQYLSHTNSGMSSYSQHSPQQIPSTVKNINLPSDSSQTGLLNSPQPPSDLNSFCFSHQWESSVIHNQQTQIFCDSHSSQHIKAQAQLTDAQNALSESNPQQTFSHQDQKQTSITMSVKKGNSTAGNSMAATSCCTGTTSMLTLGSLSPDVKTSSSTQPSQVHLSRATVGLAVGDPQASNNNMLDNKTLLPSKPFTYPEAADYQDTRDKTQNDYTNQSSNSGRPDISSKYQSFFFSGQLHGYPPAECLTSGVRPVQSCQDAAEDTSSSDDEGKLIIEL